MLDEDLLQDSQNEDGAEDQEVNPYIQQRSQSMFLQNDSNVDDLIDYAAANLQTKKVNKRKGSAARKKKN